MSRVLYILLAFVIGLSASQKLDKLVIAGPVATVSHPFFKMIKDGALNDVAKRVEFVLWKNPDELRAILLNNGASFVAIPTNVAANLYNKNIDIKLLNVPVWGILEILSRDANAKSIDDFKNKEIVVPFRSDMPDIVLQALIKKAGYDVKKDFKLNYVATPPDAMQMMIMRRADNVLLAEPATSMAMRKTGSFPISLIAPEIFRSIKLENEWGRVFKTQSKIPTAGIAVVGDVDKEVVNRFEQEYAKALEWYKTNPLEAGELVAKNINMFKAEAISDSIEHVKLQNTKAIDAKKDLEDFFNIILEIEPKLIGGKLPSDGFYYK